MIEQFLTKDFADAQGKSVAISPGVLMLRTPPPFTQVPRIGTG